MKCAMCKRPDTPGDVFEPVDYEGVHLCGRTECRVRVDLERLGAQTDGPDTGGDR